MRDELDESHYQAYVLRWDGPLSEYIAAQLEPTGVHAKQGDAVTVLISELSRIEWSESAMRELASHWISPSPCDAELTRFATGHPSAVDWAAFDSECEYNQRMYARDYDSRFELETLMHYARERMILDRKDQ